MAGVRVAGLRAAGLTAVAELDAAGIDDPALRAGYRLCRRLNAEHGKTYYLATLLLPAAQRPHVHALYGFARYVDDIVDDLAGSPTERAERFAAWTGDFLTELDWGASSDPVRRAVLNTITTWALPTEYFAQFLAAMRMDLTVTGYATYADLRAYMWGSAAVIGLEMVPILGRADDTVRWDRLEGPAVDLGLAFQLTNFIRDVGEDLRRGRVYLPQESLDQFGVDRARLARGAVDEPIRNLLAHEIERARGLYRSAAVGVELVAAGSRDCLRTAMALYGAILDRIEQADYDVFDRRITVPRRRRAAVGAAGLARAVQARRTGPGTGATPGISAGRVGGSGPATPRSTGSR